MRKSSAYLVFLAAFAFAACDKTSDTKKTEDKKEDKSTKEDKKKKGDDDDDDDDDKKSKKKKADDDDDDDDDESTGVDECDEYLKVYKKCVVDPAPPAAKKSLEDSIKTQKDTFKKSAANKAAKDALASSCQQMIDTTKKQCKK